MEHKCKSCGAPIYWIKTKGGKSMPVNTEYKTIISASGFTHTGYESHFATCPDAAKFRNKPTQGGA